MIRRIFGCALAFFSLVAWTNEPSDRAFGAPAFDAATARGDALPTHGAKRAAALVQQALDAELAGDEALRRDLLAKAIKADPEFAAARWQLGQIKFQGEWKDVAEIGATVSGDPRWEEYNERRALAGSVDEHLALGRWCERQGLADEAHYHWANVLLADPSNEPARERLGLQPYRGGLYTAEEVAEFEQRAKQAKKDYEHHKPLLAKLCARAVTRGPGCDEALADIAAIDDPAQLDALDYAVHRARRKARDDRGEKLEQAHVAALAKFPAHGATLRLLNYSILSPSEETRLRAGQALATRPGTDYVPLLMAALTAPYQAETSVFAAPDGTVRLLQTVYQEGPEASRTHTVALNLETEGALKRDKAETNPAAVLQSNLARAGAASSALRASLESANAMAAERNRRIGQVLQVATGTIPADRADTWWRAWQEYNELSYAEERPNYQTSFEETYTYQYAQERPMYLQEVRSPPAGGPCECFAAGTPVWTKSGPNPIESIVVGDLVLAQNSLTGELAYRAVLETTTSQPVRVLALKLPKETIISTLGHRFWTPGQGWLMAKSFSGGSRLHALTGSVEAATSPVSELTVCHNLIVDDFHTFFVGQSRLLVHDKSCPAPNPASLPGSVRPREAAPPDVKFAEALAKADGER